MPVFQRTKRTASQVTQRRQLSLARRPDMLEEWNESDRLDAIVTAAEDTNQDQRPACMCDFRKDEVQPSDQTRRDRACLAMTMYACQLATELHTA